MITASVMKELKENFSPIIYFLFSLNWPRWNSINLFTKMIFSFQTHISVPFTQDIYMTFYLLTRTYFNEVNECRNILINSQLKRILFMSSDKKIKQKWERQKKHGKRKQQQWKWGFSENEIPDLNSLKPFEFKP